jgi:hypothetical protein
MTESIQSTSGRAPFYALVAIMWLAVPFTAFRYWSVWDRLPARLATHFGADGRPNGWMTPQQSLSFSLMMIAILLTVFTVILLYTSRRTVHLGASSWAMLAVFYVITGVMTYINDSVLQYNVSGSSIPLGGVAVVVIIAVVVFAAIFATAKRGSALTDSTLISEEKQASLGVAIVCLIPAAVTVAVVINVPVMGLKLALSAAAVVMVGCAAMAWDGFHYLFSPSGVEVRTLGFRLRSIPVNEIQSYAVDRWKSLGGYGIRGVGDTRAYVWSKTGVRIKTSEGEVFLGHTEPGRLIHDLDLLTQHKVHERAPSS